MSTPDVSDAPPKEEPKVYKHSLSGHQVQGDATFKEINDHERPYEGGAEKAQHLPDINVFAEAAGMKEKEKEDTKPLEPLPEIPGMPMTTDQAYDCARASAASRRDALTRCLGARALARSAACASLRPCVRVLLCVPQSWASKRRTVVTSRRSRCDSER